MYMTTIQFVDPYVLKKGPGSSSSVLMSLVYESTYHYAWSKVLIWTEIVTRSG